MGRRTDDRTSTTTYLFVRDETTKRPGRDAGAREETSCTPQDSQAVSLAEQQDGPG